MHPIRVFPLTGSEEFGKQLTKQLKKFARKVKYQELESGRFGDQQTGELYYRFPLKKERELNNKTVIIAGSAHTDQQIEEVYRWGCAAQKYGARRLIFVVPFLGYSTMERAVKPGEIVSAKTVLRKFSFIPKARRGNDFFFMDLHKEGLRFYTGGDSIATPLSAKKILRRVVEKWELGEVVFGSADLGGAKSTEKFAQLFNADIAVVNKHRDKSKVKVMQVIGNVKGKPVVIFDDMLRSGDTMILAAEAYLAAGATEVSAVVTHGAFNTEDLIKKIARNKALKRIAFTNTHPMSQHPLVKANKKFEVYDVTKIFAKAIWETIK